MRNRHRSWKFVAGTAFLVLSGGLAPCAGGERGNRLEWPAGFSLVPQDAVAVLSMEKGGRFLEAGGPAGGAFLERLARWLGVKKETLSSSFFEGPFTAALFPAREEGPSLLLVFPDCPGGRKEFFALLARSPGAFRPAGRLAGAEVGSYTLPPPVGLRFFTIQRGDTFLAATSKELLSQALEAETSPATKSLQADAALARIFRSGAYRGEARFFVSFKQGLFGRGSFFPGAPVEAGSWVSWISTTSGNRVETSLRVEWPEPRGGWGGLAGEKSLPRDLEKFLPGPGDLVVSAGLLPPEGGKTFPVPRSLQDHLPLPWRRLFASWSGDFRLRIQSGPGGKPRWAALLDLTNPTRTDQVMRTPGKVWKEKDHTTGGGYTITTLEGPGGKVCSWAIAGGRLYLASDPVQLEEVLAGGKKVPAAPPADTGSTGRKTFLSARGEVEVLAGLLPSPFRGLLRGCTGEFTLKASADPAGLGFSYSGMGRPPGFHLLETLSLPRASSGEGLAAAGEGKRTSGTDWKSLTPKERFQALVSLEKAGDVQVYADEVEALLEDPDPAVAARAAYILGTHGVVASVPALCKTLRDSPNPVVRRYAAYALMRMPDPREENFLLQALADEDPLTRGYAATALERLHSRRAAPALARALVGDRKAPKETRLRLLSALAELGGPEEIPKVALGVGPREDVDLLRAQVYALQKLTPHLQRKEEEALLVQLLDLPSSFVRGYAVDRLGEIGEPAVAEVLEERMKREGPQFRKRIEAALSLIRERGGASLALEKAVDTASRKMAKAREILVKAVAGVKGWPAWKKGLLAALPLVLAGILFFLWRWLRARAAMKAHMKLITLVSSSEEEEAFPGEEGAFPEGEVDQEVPWEEEGEEPLPEAAGEAEQIYLDDESELDEMVPAEGEDEAFLDRPPGG